MEVSVKLFVLKYWTGYNIFSRSFIDVYIKELTFAFVSACVISFQFALKY